jgi:anti-anti-sigma regulatory factor
MVKISEVGSPNGSVIVRVEGEVTGHWSAEVDRYCQSILQSGRHLIVDVAEVTFLDREGVRVLRNLRAGNAELVNCSLFLAELLR